VKGEKGKWAPICAQVLGEKECVAARRPHILRLIDQHPEHTLAGGWGARIYPTSLDPLTDPAGYAEAKRLWLKHAARPDVSVAMLKNASYFFEAADKALCEKMLLQAQALDPKGSWSGSLGRLYAFILVGSNSSTPLNVVRTVSLEDAHSSYAQEIRRKLDQSTDPLLLSTAGNYLIWARGRKLDFDPAALGKSYLERARQLKPDMPYSNLRLLSQRIGERNQLLTEKLRDVPKESRMQALLAMPEDERLYLLPNSASSAYMIGEYWDYTKDQEKATESWNEARTYAQDMLGLAATLRDHPGRGTAIYIGNLVLGALTFREGNRQGALKYMQAASQAPASEDFDLHVSFHVKLTAWLLKYGERDTVIEFLERVANLSDYYKSELLAAANQIRNGYQPIWYPRDDQGQPAGRER
jgi:hypothetical protein